MVSEPLEPPSSSPSQALHKTAPPAANNGTAGKPPTYVIQKDQHGNPVELSDTITFLRSYSQYSFEELRVGDYSREDIHPISGSSHAARKAEAPPSLPIAAEIDRLDFKLDLSLMDSLVPNKCKPDKSNATILGVRRDIEHAPLLSAPVVTQHAKDLVPQVGFIGNHLDEAGHDVSLFHNTNVPFSAFICGVQGSGKSHTTACLLENALIPSKNLGRLEAPACALVFSYGSWSTGGAGFSVSEAVHLARAQPDFPGQNVRRITVLVSADNAAIGSHYEDPFRNIRVIPFKLNAKALDIAGLRALMGIGDKSPPLYMGQVEMVLRKMSRTRKDGVLDYKSFAKEVDRIDLNEAQTQALKQRLAMLESFLDLDGKAAEPEFLPGEMVIMDLSDAFMSSSTACVLFKLGMDRFLQSSVKSKMVVLDEAHKYMSDSPGSKFLADSLYHTIRVQRHLGTRVIISTQEPTVSTDLIALCNMSVIHRFTSPTWYAALKRHISGLDDDKALMQEIEGLATGEALVYCPNTVLAQNDDGSLVKATGRLLKINIRKRITQDGGESIMAV
ncbi:hypothetical protein J4E93_002876 [Alternaria ventricosa]|uniref:uncharacterized protein n=1 Tax=Alternaria ventricosa TaxID=1187951 RepID=UPI0020C2BA51|nr:uncharacterized protein J4E93_002876 [Alternaria ventricosa]KAI4650520.1 hypothetical protein J4E93_002876 [Alternaria ventricosa]